MRISDWSSDVCSSDLIDKDGAAGRLCHTRLREAEIFDIRRATRRDEKALRDDGFGNPVAQHHKRRVPFRRLADGLRSEEHTSELQSLMRISYAVFCLKKKTQQS